MHIYMVYSYTVIDSSQIEVAGAEQPTQAWGTSSALLAFFMAGVSLEYLLCLPGPNLACPVELKAEKDAARQS